MILINDSTNASRKLPPFDAASINDFPIYNRLPYSRDIDLCPPESITLISGNILKYFQYSLKETLSLLNIDNLAIQKIQEYQLKENIKIAGGNQNDGLEAGMANDEDVIEVTEEKKEKSQQELDYLNMDFE